MDPVQITTALVLIALILQPRYLKPFRTRAGRFVLLIVVVGLSRVNLILGLLAAVAVATTFTRPRRHTAPLRQADRLNVEHLMRPKESYLQPSVHRTDEAPESEFPEKYTLL